MLAEYIIDNSFGFAGLLGAFGAFLQATFDAKTRLLIRRKIITYRHTATLAASQKLQQRLSQEHRQQGHQEVIRASQSYSSIYPMSA